MAFTGKATYTAGSTLPEIAEDVSDLVSIVSPHETPLLDALGDPLVTASSTRHEWLEDSLLPNTDAINMPAISDGATDTTALTVANGSRFRVGDQIQALDSTEVMLVTDVTGNVVTVTRGYGSTTKQELLDTLLLTIFGNAALEAADATSPRFTVRTRKSNYTQIFSAALQVSGSEAAVRQIAVDDEMDYQPTRPIHFCSVTTLGEKQAFSVPDTNAQFCVPFRVQKKLTSTFNCRSNARNDSTSNSIVLRSRFMPSLAKRPSCALKGLLEAMLPAIWIVCLAVRHFLGRLCHSANSHLTIFASLSLGMGSKCQLRGLLNTWVRGTTIWTFPPSTYLRS